MRWQTLLDKNSYVCRGCINDRYGIHLVPKNCHYTFYTQQCKVCGGVHQMPESFTVAGKLKILFAHKK